MQECIYGVKVWMSSNKLKLNDDKTEAMIVPPQRMSASLPMPDSLTVGTSNEMLSKSVKTLGVMLDTHLTMKNKVLNLARTANFDLRRIDSIRHYLSVEATQKPVLAVVMSRLDYCNTLLYGCPQYLINRLQKVETMLCASS